MVRKIVWSSLAIKIFTDILEFYNHRNGSKKYSQKLTFEIYQLIKTLSAQPYLGQNTSNPNIRVVVKNNYKIYYKVNPSEIIIYIIWDCRQDSEKLKFYINDK